MVSDVVYERDTAGVYGSAEGGVEEVPAALWLWCPLRFPLDFVLRQHQGLKCLDWCDLFLVDRLLHGSLRTADFQA